MSAKNPCIDICKFTDQVCIGCGRTKAEVRGWKKLEKDERREIVELSKQRLKALKGAVGRKSKKH
jgi:predicted Fe-S protein YdhL (DUF1289 family)